MKPNEGRKYPRYKMAKDGGDIVEILDPDDGEVIGTAVDLEYAALWTASESLLMAVKRALDYAPNEIEANKLRAAIADAEPNGGNQ